MKNKKSKKVVDADLKKNHDFEWALDRMKAGKTVVRESWLPQMAAAGMGRSETHFVALIPAEENKALDDVQAEFMGQHTKDILVPAHFVKGTVIGLWQPGWVPTAEDLLAEDWGLAFREYAKYVDNWRKKKAG